MAEAVKNSASWDPTLRAGEMADRSVLLVGGSRDATVLPLIHHAPIVEALQAAGCTGLTHTMLDADHCFSDKRIALARTVLGWLEKRWWNASGASAAAR